MIRKLIPVLLAATLSACANTGAPARPARPRIPAPARPPPAAGLRQDPATARWPAARPARPATPAPCNPRSAKSHPAVLEDLRSRSSQTARMLRPGQLVTMEYNDTRLNLIVDGKDVMTAIRCG